MHRRDSYRGNLDGSNIQSSRGRREFKRTDIPHQTPSSSSQRFNRSNRDSAESHIPRSVDLISNAYGLEFYRSGAPVYEYKLHVSLSKECQDQSTQVLTRNFVCCSIRRLIMGSIMKDLGASEEASAGRVIIESNLEAIYCFKPLSCAPQDETSIQPIRFENISVNSNLLSNLKIDISIVYLGITPVSDSPSLCRSILSSSIHHQLLLDLLRFGPAYFPLPKVRSANRHPEPKLDLISELTMGLSLSGLRAYANDQTLVVINCPHAYITGSHKLIDLLVSFILNRQSENSSQAEHQCSNTIQSIVGDEPWFLAFCKILNGFKCQSSSLEGLTNLRFNLTPVSALSLIVVDQTSQTEISISALFHQLGITLKYPNLPCLKSKSRKYPYYPIELCSLMPGQKVPIFRLSSGAQLRLQQLNKPKPDIYRQYSYRARDQIEFYARSQLKSFGINLSKTPISAKGSMLAKPILQFRNQDFEPNKDFWESKIFLHPIHLVENWCVVNTVPIDSEHENVFFNHFCQYLKNVGLNMSPPCILQRPKEVLLEEENAIEKLINDCRKATRKDLNFIMFIIDSGSTALNRLIHLSFDSHPKTTATCLRAESILNMRQHRSIIRTLAHKVNARLGGTNLSYAHQSLAELSLCREEIMIVGLDVTHPDNELSGVSIVGCAYTYTEDLFKHKSLVWPQTARLEIIHRMDALIKRILQDYSRENHGRIPRQIIVYRDGVSHEEFERVRDVEVNKAQMVLRDISKKRGEPIPNLSYIIAQKRHTMRFFELSRQNIAFNPPGGTLIDKDVVQNGREFYLYSNTNLQATSRPLHYHVIANGLGLGNLQRLTYFLCFNFGKCSSTLSMPSSLKYAHNAAYDARNRVIAAREFCENKFYPSKFFC